MQNADDRNKPRNVDALRRALDAVLCPCEPSSHQSDPNQSIRVREATNRMGFAVKEYKKALKAQLARDMRSEITYGPRLPEPFKDNGPQYFLESQIIDGLRGIKKRAALVASDTTLLDDEERQP